MTEELIPATESTAAFLTDVALLVSVGCLVLGKVRGVLEAFATFWALVPRFRAVRVPVMSSYEQACLVNFQVPAQPWATQEQVRLTQTVFRFEVFATTLHCALMWSFFAVCDEVGGQRLFAGAKLATFVALVNTDSRIVSIIEGEMIEKCKNSRGPVCISTCRLIFDFVLKPCFSFFLLMSRSQPSHRHTKPWFAVASRLLMCSSAMCW